LLINAQSRLLNRFETLKATKNFVEVAPPFLTRSIPQYANVLNALELERMRAIRHIANGKLELGITELLEGAAFSRRLLANANTLVSHAIGLASIQKNFGLSVNCWHDIPNWLNMKSVLRLSSSTFLAKIIRFKKL
jgi:hypothetical protein